MTALFSDRSTKLPNKPIGFNLVFCGIQWVGMPHEQVTEQMHIMAEDVLPKVRQGI